MKITLPWFSCTLLLSGESKYMVSAKERMFCTLQAHSLLGLCRLWGICGGLHKRQVILWDCAVDNNLLCCGVSVSALQGKSLFENNLSMLCTVSTSSSLQHNQTVHRIWKTKAQQESIYLQHSPQPNSKMNAVCCCPLLPWVVGLMQRVQPGSEWISRWWLGSNSQWWHGWCKCVTQWVTTHHQRYAGAGGHWQASLLSWWGYLVCKGIHALTGCYHTSLLNPSHILSVPHYLDLVQLIRPIPIGPWDTGGW